LTVSTCAGSTADTVLAVYSDCNTSIACQDDGCGTSNLESTISVCVTGGHTYYVREGGYNGVRWAGSWSLAFNPPPSPAFTANPVCVAQGTPAVLRATITNFGCPPQSILSAVANDSALGGSGSVTLNNTGTAPDGGANDSVLAGFSAPVTVGPGVYNVPVTVTFSGAGAVVQNASVTVGVYTTPGGATAEADACGISGTDSTNGGCNISTTSPPYSTAQLCTDYVGTAASTVQNRDLDWWSFTVPAADTVTISGQTKFHDPVLVVLDNACANTTYGAGTGCTDFSFTASLPAAGTYVFVIGPPYQVVDGILEFDGSAVCGSTADYHFRISPSAGCGSTGSCCTNTNLPTNTGGNQCNVTSQAACLAVGGTWTAGGTCTGPASCNGGHFCGTANFNCDGDSGTDADIEAFFSCLSGNCPPLPCVESANFNGDDDTGTDSDIEAFFRVLAGGNC
jgi:hypothetical protein